jgi:serine/threonine protein phosphatase PrpC/serine/threonine protein kinase
LQFLVLAGLGLGTSHTTTISAMSFDIDIGHASACGPRETNEDFAAVQRPSAADTPMGWVAALADGVSGGGAGRMAAQTTVMSLVLDYFSAPATWDTTVVLDRLIRAQNTWLAEHNRRSAWARDHTKTSGTALTTLTTLVLRGHSWTLAHVGDSRAWLWRTDECSQLTQDHKLAQQDLPGMITRAVGLDEHVQVDFLQGELQAGDTFVLTSDGVHGPLTRRRLQALFAQATDAQQCADMLVREALAAGGQDNATALVLRVRGLDAGRYDDVLQAGRRLPVVSKLTLGTTLDGYTITALVADTAVHRLYQAREQSSGQLVAIKTLHESRASDDEERAMLSHEAWLGARLTERLAPNEACGFVRVREASNASAFYVVFDWHAGRTLEQRLAAGQRGGMADIVTAAIHLTQAIGRLHRAGVVHRDIKPANLHLGEDGQWRILDLGVAVSGREPKSQRSLRAGTPSYMNPEQWPQPGHEPAPPDAGSDLFAFGVTLYQWLTGRLPYGEIEPFQNARYRGRRDPPPPSRLAPDVPIWLDHIVCKAVAIDAAQRFETAEELLLALRRGASRPLNAPLHTPLLARDPLMLWRIAFALSALLNVLLLVWLLFLPR